MIRNFCLALASIAFRAYNSVHSTSAQSESEALTSCFLPFEIVEMIIDLLAEKNDINSLKAMSLLCQSALPRCRKYLFFDLNIDTNLFNSAKRCRILLSPQTDIPKYVRRLKYHLRRHSRFNIDPATLERMPYLQSLTLQYCEYLTAFDWIRIDPSLRSALLNFIHQPTLTHLHLIDIDNFPISILSSCTSLKHLQLDYVDVMDECPATFLPSSPRLDAFTVPRIQEYTMGRRSATTTMRLLNAKLDGRVALDFTNLKRLSVTFERNADVEATRSLLKEAKQVEELRVDVSTYNSIGLTGLADMGFHTFGTTLCLCLDTNFNTQHGIFELYNEFSAMATANNTLKFLKLQVNDAHEILFSGEWEKLDVVLSSPGWFGLQDISLDMLVWDYGGTEEDFKLLIDWPKTQLTRLSSRRSLDLKFSVRLETSGRIEP